MESKVVNIYVYIDSAHPPTNDELAAICLNSQNLIDRARAYGGIANIYRRGVGTTAPFAVIRGESLTRSDFLGYMKDRGIVAPKCIINSQGAV